ncbi:MAG: DUF3788 domain-containing protein [Peptococcaceae bacterium]|nr:DUF3788 domain-containing protein [Peptococcaceae bacterium]
MNEEQLLRDPSIEPTSEVMASALGAANAAYVIFVEGLESHDVQVDWRYYNDGKAWLGKGLYKWTGARGGQKEITIFWLSIWDGFFKVSFFIPEKARMDALNLSFADDVKKMIEDAKQMGKLKFFPIIFDLRSDKLFHDIDTLIEFRKAIK